MPVGGNSSKIKRGERTTTLPGTGEEGEGLGGEGGRCGRGGNEGRVRGGGGGREGGGGEDQGFDDVEEVVDDGQH